MKMMHDEKNSEKEKKQFLIPKLLLQMWKEKFFFVNVFWYFFRGLLSWKCYWKLLKKFVVLFLSNSCLLWLFVPLFDSFNINQIFEVWKELFHRYWNISNRKRSEIVERHISKCVSTFKKCDSITKYVSYHKVRPNTVNIFLYA